MVSMRKMITLDNELIEKMEYILREEGYSWESFQEWVRKTIREIYTKLKEEKKNE